MNTPELKLKIANLAHLNQEDCDNSLREIMTEILRNYHIEIDGWILYPTEVEAYFYGGNHKDVYVHQNELQNNRFGQLYVHRHPKNKTKEGRPKGWAGIDLCLSDDKDNKDVFFGLLIRAARINDLEAEPVVGPYNLYCALKDGKPSDYYKTLESNTVALKENDSPIQESVYFSKRIGLKPQDKDPNGRYLGAALRAVRAKLLKGTKYQRKEDLFNGRQNTPSGLSYEEYAQNVLGYVPKEK